MIIPKAIVHSAVSAAVRTLFGMRNTSTPQKGFLKELPWHKKPHPTRPRTEVTYVSDSLFCVLNFLLEFTNLNSFGLECFSFFAFWRAKIPDLGINQDLTMTWTAERSRKIPSIKILAQPTDTMAISLSEDSPNLASSQPNSRTRQPTPTRSVLNLRCRLHE